MWANLKLLHFKTLVCLYAAPAALFRSAFAKQGGSGLPVSATSRLLKNCLPYLYPL